MKSCLIYLLFSIVIIQVHLNLRSEKRQELIDKLAEKISVTNIDQDFTEYKDDYLYGYSFQKMNYSVTDIQELQYQYDLPENFNFLTETGAKPDVKNQASCGCCWSFAASSALAYRYKKYGIDVSLSPKDALSCYLPQCSGNNGIDPQLNLVKNGSLTESCFPYASSDGKTMPECPTKCADGSEYKKYYSQNAYQVDNYSQEKFYDFVILVMDQLVTYGPVRGAFDYYADLTKFSSNKTRCKNDVYTYDGSSVNYGGHAIAVVG